MRGSSFSDRQDPCNLSCHVPFWLSICPAKIHEEGRAATRPRGKSFHEPPQKKEKIKTEYWTDLLIIVGAFRGRLFGGACVRLTTKTV